MDTLDHEIVSLHKAIRSDKSFGDRYRILAWGFIRGVPYRRMEPTHRKTVFEGLVPPYEDMSFMLPFTVVDGRTEYEHNLPSAYTLIKLLSKHIPYFSKEIDGWKVRSNSIILAWLSERAA